MLFRWMDEISPKMGIRGGLRFNQIPLELVFESGDEGAGELLAKLEDAKKGLFANRILSINFEDKKNAIALQAADLVAYETVKQFVRRIGADGRPLRRSLQAAEKEIPHYGEYLGWEWFQAQLARRRSAGHGPSLTGTAIG